MGQRKGKWYVAKDAQARFVQWGHLRSLSKWEKGKKESN